MYATPCNSEGIETLRALLGFTGAGPLGSGLLGGLLGFSSSSALVTSNVPVCKYLEPNKTYRYNNILLLLNIKITSLY